MRKYIITEKTTKEIKERLEYLREQIQAENISYGEIVELQDLAKYIENEDVELLEPAGVPEFPICIKCSSDVTREKVGNEYLFYCEKCNKHYKKVEQLDN